MPAVDPFGPVDATAAADPSVAIMRAAAEKRAQDLQAFQQKQSMEAAQEERTKASAALAQTHDQHVVKQDESAALRNKMVGDIAVSQPAYKQNGRVVQWDENDPSTLQSFQDRYGIENMGAAADEWNKRAPQQNRFFVQKATSLGLKVRPDASNDELQAMIADETQRSQVAKSNQVPSDIKSELVRLKAWRDGMSPEEAGQARDDAYMRSGIIPERYQKPAQALAAQIVRHPILAPFAKQKEAYDTLKSGFENPQSGGFGDMAMIEGFQRIVNPGAVVRQGTMDNMQAAAGWLQQVDPSFQWSKAHTGDKLNPAARQRLMQLAEVTFAKSQQTAAHELAAKQRYARMLGIPNAEAFVNNVLDYVAQSAENPSNLPPAANLTPANQAPVSQDTIELAKRALNDPNASEAHKAAARRILGQ